MNELQTETSGLSLSVDGNQPVHVIPSFLPAQERSNIFRLALAHDKFLAICERHQPSLTGEHAHFSDLIHVDERITMDSPENRVLEASFDRLQVLCRQIPLLCRDNPGQISLGLESNHLLNVEQKIFLAQFPDYFANPIAAGQAGPD